MTRKVDVGINGAYALVSDEDYARVSALTWTLKTDKKSRTSYAIHQDKHGRIYMHTLITGFAETHHIDYNGLNNQRDNLKKVTHAQNIQAQQVQARSKSGYRGVTFFPFAGEWIRRKPWRVRLKVNGADKTYGYFKTPEEAAVLWNQLAREAWGEHAFQNILPERKEAGGP